MGYAQKSTESVRLVKSSQRFEVTSFSNLLICLFGALDLRLAWALAASDPVDVHQYLQGWPDRMALTCPIDNYGYKIY